MKIKMRTFSERISKNTTKVELPKLRDSQAANVKTIFIPRERYYVDSGEYIKNLVVNTNTEIAEKLLKNPINVD